MITRIKYLTPIYSSERISMKETFAGNCVLACDNNPNASDSVKLACDTGSQQYCSTGTNLFTPDCKNYFKRVTANAVADRISAVYSNPIKTSTVAGKPQSAQDYYNAITETVTTNVYNDFNLIKSADLASVIEIIKTNNPDYKVDPFYKSMVQSGVKYCVGSETPDAGMCAESSMDSWIVNEYNNTAQEILELFKKTVPSGSVFTTLNELEASKWKRLIATAKMYHTRAPNSCKPVDDWFLSTLTKDDLKEPLLVEIRTVSPYLQAGIDAFIINLINGPKNQFTIERLAATTNVYDLALTVSDELYSPPVRAFYNNLVTFNLNNQITTDPFEALIKTTDNANITNCSTGNNAIINPLCSKIGQTTGAVAASNILNSAVAYCSDTTNVYKPQCIDHINSNQNSYNINDVNNKMLMYCIKDGLNDANCKPFSALKDSNAWLDSQTANTKDINGKIVSACGKSGGLPTETCIDVCKAYPDLCEKDLQQKCILPEHRYSNNTEFYTNKKTYSRGGSSMSNSAMRHLIPDTVAYILWFIVFIFASFMFVNWLFTNMKRRPMQPRAAAQPNIQRPMPPPMQPRAASQPNMQRPMPPPMQPRAASQPNMQRPIISPMKLSSM